MTIGYNIIIYYVFKTFINNEVGSGLVDVQGQLDM